MAKTITNNTRQNDQYSVLHLFEFDMYNFDGTFDETLRFTDHDIFVHDGTNEYTPLSITFDKLSENMSMQSDSINVDIDNVSGGLSAEALASEWRNNRAKITRVIYSPHSDMINEEEYPFGYGVITSQTEVFNDLDDFIVYEQGLPEWDLLNEKFNQSGTDIIWLYKNTTLVVPNETYNVSFELSNTDSNTDVVFFMGAYSDAESSDSIYVISNNYSNYDGSPADDTPSNKTYSFQITADNDYSGFVMLLKDDVSLDNLIIERVNKYPVLNISEFTNPLGTALVDLDNYTLFEGIVDTFSATESSLSATLTSLFTNWSKAYPTRKYNQTEFTTIIDTMTDEITWGH